MKEIKIGKNDAGKRVDRFLKQAYPSLPTSLVYRYLRTKRIKLFGKRVAGDYRLQEGDMLELYINDELLEAREQDLAPLKIEPKLDIVYEDDNIMIVDKPKGVIVHSDDAESYNTLIAHIQAYLYRKGEYNPQEEQSFAPALCNRIDRNTAGLCIAAKNAEALRDMNEIIKTRQITKIYLALVKGVPSPKSATLTGYLVRDMQNKTVSISDKPSKGALSVVTKYTVLEQRGDNSLVEVDLITGRTHQIRAHMAHIGHPIVGDGKYGKTGKREGKGQTLVAYKVMFDLEHYRGLLSYLAKKEFFSQHIKIFEEFSQNS